MKRRVVITGMGAVSPIGNTVKEMWENARAGVCGIDYIKSFDTTDHKVKVAGELKDFDITDYMDKMAARRTARFTQLALVAAREAVSQAKLDMTREDAARCGVNISSGIGGLPTIEEEHYKGIKRGFDKVSPLFVPMAITNMAAGMAAIEFGFRGSCTCVVTACASGTNAIGEAFRQIRDGYADVFLTGGSESCISELGIGGFTSMKALSESCDPARASIPFDKERNGFVMGEGAGVLLLEEYEHAVSRGAEILGEIVGYGASCDANHMTAPLEDGSGAAACMKAALEDGDVLADQIAYINAHGTSTPMNDKCETRAVKSAFGDVVSALLMSSTKSMTGHLLGASGAVEAILTVCALKEQFAPPTIGYQNPDPDCDLDIVANAGKAMTGDYAMSNSLGFGGHNGSIVFRRAK
ncbi:beta-ketoacyl-ACP synthase II [Ihubacter sp. mB4P-1]|uniref:beta-ketoacyl-ACP synthase II n=1 Tax=Ihubacter sp. mB4P-1 TaxID=3242370 RepID=UPI00137B0EF0